MGDSMNILDGDGSGADVQLPNEILLHVFRFLDYEDLIRAEQVCRRWKDVVEIRFATQKRLDIRCFTKDYPLKRLRRYGPSIRSLKLYCRDTKIDWAEEIADRFPNLSTLELDYNQFTNLSLKYLSTKCQKLKNVAFDDCDISDAGLRSFLQALPRIKSLNISSRDDGFAMIGGRWVPRYRNNLLNPADASAVFSNCRSLKTLHLGGTFGSSDTASFSRFCKECVTLRKLSIGESDMPKEMFVQIQHCSLLEELTLYGCNNVDGSTLIQISKGCPNLRSVSLFEFSPICDKSLKCFAKNRKLISFVTDSDEVTDETLFELAKCGSLSEVKLSFSPLVSDRGCAALLAHCPQLEYLDVTGCKGVGNATVDAAIEAVKSRQNGLVLQLIAAETGIPPQVNENYHPLLHLDSEDF